MKENISKEKIKESFQIVADVLKSDIIKNLQHLFVDIQKDRPKEEIITKVLNGSPFQESKAFQESEAFKESKAVEAKKEVSPVKNPVKTGFSKKWTEQFNSVIHYAASESTPLSRRTKAYLVKKLPFSADAISRQVYRLGYKWRNGKVVLA